MRAAKVQASLRIRAVSPEPSLLAHTSSESRGTVRQKARSLAPLNGWTCAVKICHDGMLEDTNSLGAALINYCWYKREHVESNALNNWKLNSFQIIKKRISFYSNNLDLLSPPPRPYPHPLNLNSLFGT